MVGSTVFKSVCFINFSCVQVIFSVILLHVYKSVFNSHARTLSEAPLAMTTLNVLSSTRIC